MDVQKFFNDLGISHFCKEPEVLLAKQEHKNKVFEDCLSILRDEYPIRPSGNDINRGHNLMEMGKIAKNIKFL